ncbi:hypothetical protein L1049_019118 [Liquidambar formosana]|uniref:Phosphoglycerate mutase n=1 Tax=Liquidambar formosana TaxID=63359 RepID=A0AAP0RB06_LIQFO
MDTPQNPTLDGPQDHHPHCFHQNVIVMRHGDRIDHLDPTWVSKALRPWDPHLIDAGKVRAFSTGRRLRTQLGFPIHRVFVSPFFRCIQTASQVIAALCAVDDDPANTTADGVSIDPSKLKVSIELGLCEILNRENVKLELDPKFENWGFNISELEAMLPAGAVDHTVEPLYKELPQWEETTIGAKARYAEVFQALADKYPLENLLLVTHGAGVGVAFSAYLKDITVHEIDYCAYTHSSRSIILGEDQSFTAGNFEHQGQASINYST